MASLSVRPVSPEHQELLEGKLQQSDARKLVTEVIDKGGRYDEYDLYGNRGGYVRLMDKNAVGRPCPECGGDVQKIQYLGGACYLCPSCQE